MTTVPYGVPLAQYMDAALKLSAAELKSAHGNGFFLVVTSRPEMEHTRQATETRRLHDDEPTGESRIFVMPLVKKEANRTPTLRLGRGESCDLVVGDISVSK